MDRRIRIHISRAHNKGWEQAINPSLFYLPANSARRGGAQNG